MGLRSRSKVKAEFNMSSMTDIIFLLLIFFVIVSSVVKDPSLRVVLPKGTPRPVVNQVVRVYIDKDRQYAVDDQVISFSRLPSTLRSVLNKNPEATVSVLGDQDLQYKYVMEVVMIADKMNAKVVLALDSKP